jgi:hypothetical protein
MDTVYLIIQRIIGLFLGILLFYSAFKLFNELKNKEIALSMVFLHQQMIIKLFGLLIVAAFFTMLTGIIFVFLGNSILVEILLDLNALVLLIFTFLLQRLMKGDGTKWK